jgi:CubicO group peptidase (beta-lactamase class C family)
MNAVRSGLATLLLAAAACAAEHPWPGSDWPAAQPADVGMDETLLHKARDYALTGLGSGIITRHGRAVIRWGDQAKRYDLKSTTKSIGMTSVGLAMIDGRLTSLDVPAKRYHPTFGVAKDGTGQREWLGSITLFHLATQTAGFEKPGGTGKLLFAPGTKWAYSDSGPNWLAECITLIYRQDVRDLLFKRVFTPLGIQPADLAWRRNAYRPKEINGVVRREFGSGVSAGVDAMARIGYLYLRRGRWKGKRILPEAFVDACRTVSERVRGLPVVKPETYGKASDHYGLLWWNNADGTLTNVPRDAYWSWGLYDSLIVVIPSLDIACARAGKSWKRKAGADHYAVLRPFLGPIASSVRAGSGSVRSSLPASAVSAAAPRPPYPPSPVIKKVVWAPASRIIRLAKGSDNWPVTWADDDRLYTAYGDGRGFKPLTEKKLSLGLATVAGRPPHIKGANLRSTSAEQFGGGASGKKASGMLMIDGVLYMAVRNAGNSQIAYSRDRGRSWTWSTWTFSTSFGYPTFVGFGKDYAGARDDFVYLVSHDADSAYKPADRMILARVPKARLMERAAYEVFGGLTAGGRPLWTRDLARRAAVFTHAGRCYRSGISYCAALKRYLWVQIIPGDDTRFRGGFGVYDAPEPWGPWTTAYFTERWDVGPGETASFPTKWMSDDGRTLWLVFSGDDCFSVRKATLTLAP